MHKEQLTTLNPPKLEIGGEDSDIDLLEVGVCPYPFQDAGFNGGVRLSFHLGRLHPHLAMIRSVMVLIFSCFHVDVA